VSFAIGNVFDFTISKFPNTVQIETTNACNSKCIICPHKTMNRKIVTMEDDLFKKIINECAKHKCKSVHLHNFGEPLLDKKIFRRIKYAKEIGLPRVKIFSNGSLLTKEFAEGLVVSGLDEIKISFDGANRSEFEKIRYPLKFDKVVNNIKQLVKIRDQVGSSMKIKIACSSTSDQSQTMTSLENCVDEFSFGKIHNWGDTEVTPRERSSIRKPCSRVWRTFTVLSNGESALCCLDYDGKVLLGNLHNSSISTIWKNEQYKVQRKLHSCSDQNKISICANCAKSFI